MKLKKKISQNSNKKNNKNKNRKRKYLAVLVFLIFLIIIFFIFFNKSFEKKIPSSHLISKEGRVEVFRNGNWSELKINEELFLNDKIRTHMNSAALINLKSKAIIRLKENTIIEIKSLIDSNIEIKQEKGSSWNKFLGILGVDNYKVKTSNAVASVRGTEFRVDVNNSNNVDETMILVGSGIVNLKTNKEEINLKKYTKALAKNEKIIKINLSLDDINEFLIQKNKTLSNLKKIRLNKIKNLGILIDFAKKYYDIDEKSIDEKLKAIDRGEINDSLIIQKAPFKKKELNEIKRINDNIKKTLKEIKELEELKANATK